MLHEYQLGTSANVLKVKKALLNKELIDENSSGVCFLDPVYEWWYRKIILKKEIVLAEV